MNGMWLKCWTPASERERKKTKKGFLSSSWLMFFYFENFLAHIVWDIYEILSASACCCGAHVSITWLQKIPERRNFLFNFFILKSSLLSRNSRIFTQFPAAMYAVRSISGKTIFFFNPLAWRMSLVIEELNFREPSHRRR